MDRIVRPAILRSHSGSKKMKMTNEELTNLIDKFDSNKDYSLPFTSNDFSNRQEEFNVLRQYWPQLRIRGDVVYKLQHFGYDTGYVL